MDLIRRDDVPAQAISREAKIAIGGIDAEPNPFVLQMGDQVAMAGRQEWPEKNEIIRQSEPWGDAREAA